MTDPAAVASAPGGHQHGPDAGKEAAGGEVAAKAEQTRAAIESAPDVDNQSGDQNNDVQLKQSDNHATQHASASERIASSSSDARAHWGTVQAALGDFVETVEAQVGLILLIIADVCASGALIYLQTHRELIQARQRHDSDLHDLPVGSEYGELVTVVAGRALGAVSTLAIVVYALELLVLLAVFKRQFATHFGYILDASVVATTIAVEMCTETKAARLLGILRIWRVFRVVANIIERERAAHDETKARLDLERVNVAQLQMEKLSSEESLKRELASRTGLEKLLYDYKDEVATLKEALEIAAQAVAEAEMLRAQHAAGQSVDAAEAVYGTQYLRQQGDYYPAVGDEASDHPAGVDASAYSYGVETYSAYQHSVETAQPPAARAEEQSVSSESDFEDAVQSDSEAHA